MSVSYTHLIAAIENGHIDRDTEDSIKQRLVAFERAEKLRELEIIKQFK